MWSLFVWVDEWCDHFLCELTSDVITFCVSWRVMWSLSVWVDEWCDHFLCELTSDAITFCVSWREMWSLSVWVTSKSVNWRQFIVRRWCKVVPHSVWVDEWQIPLYQKQERADWMFSDFLAFAFMALVFIFALACIMLERRNCNTSAAKKAKRKPKRGKRVTRSHCEDHQFTARRGPEEHSDDESYNPRGKIIR